MSNKSLLKTLGVLAGLVLFSMLARLIITGGYPTVKLSPASVLDGPISVGIGQTSAGALPAAGKDYQIKNVRYFNDKEWVVVKILPLKTKADPAVLVLKKVDGVYQTVLGPAGQFSSSYLYVMPRDVGYYLSQQGLLI